MLRTHFKTQSKKNRSVRLTSVTLGTVTDTGAQMQRKCKVLQTSRQEKVRLKNVQSGTKLAGTINLVPLKMLHRHYAPANEIQRVTYMEYKERSTVQCAHL